MSEEQELLARIGKLAGSINLHRRAEQDYSKPRQHSNSSNPVPWRSARLAPYSHDRGRAGRHGANPHRNRSLVLNNATQSSAPKDLTQGPASAIDGSCRSDGDSGRGLTQPATGWVTKHDRHMQLINSSVFDRETQIRSKAIDHTRRQRALQRNQREKYKINKHLRGLVGHASRSSAIPTGTVSPIVHEIQIEGLRFHVMEGGSKLARIRGTFDSMKPTPKKACVGGVTFLRSKNGNLYRSGIVKAKKYVWISRPNSKLDCTKAIDLEDMCTNLTFNRESGKVKKIDEPCKRFTTTGQCPKGPLCPYVHNPAAVAICKEFLQTGSCPAGDACDLSHDPTPERVPACLHFLRGKCSNPSCRYAHVRVNPSALVCRDFAVLGYCGKGVNCSERHVHECPDYANTGTCRSLKCLLPHVDRAGQIRKHSANSAEKIIKRESESPGEDSDGDLSSAEEDYDRNDSDDVDSDGLEEDLTLLADNVDFHAFSQQQDFVHF